MKRLSLPSLTLPILLLTAAFVPAVSRAAEVLQEEKIIRKTTDDYTRVIIRLPKAVNLRVVNMIDTAGYFYIDFYGIQPGFTTPRVFPVQDASLRNMQTFWYKDQNVLRILFLPINKTVFRVVDLDSGHTFDTSAPQANAFRPNQHKAEFVLVDTVKNRETAFPSAADLMRKVLMQQSRKQTPTGQPAKRIIVLDPGHGGKSIGAVSRHSVGGVKIQEKDVVLAVAKEVQRLLNKTPVATAILTRDGDIDMNLTDRVDFTESVDADMFVSIHANAAQYHKTNNAPRGVEFYYLSPNSNPDARALEMAENEETAPLDPNASRQLQLITKNMAKDIQDELRGESSEVAAKLDGTFRQDTYYGRFNRGVKSAAFKVLRNQICPSILVEIGFIDHENEVRNLANPEFQKRIAKLIANGILDYISVLDNRIQRYQYQMAY